MITTLVALSSVIAAQSLDEFFAEFVAKREHIHTVAATFKQDNISADETTSSAGRIVFVKPKQLLFEYLDPKVTYAIDGSRVYEYNADLEQVQVYDVEDSAQADAFFIAFDNNASRLREAYDVSILEAEKDACGPRVLKLVPKKAKKESEKDAESTQPYREIRLYLRADDLLPCQIRAFNDDGSEARIKIDKYDVNGAGSQPSIRFHVPEGTKIIVNETKAETVGAGGKDLPDNSPPADAKPATK